MPLGWLVDKTAGSPAPNTVFVTNGKSVLNGQKRALLLVKSTPTVCYTQKETTKSCTMQLVEEKEIFVYPAKSVNMLARYKFKEKLLKEILFDLMVCKIEGWDKKEYIKELSILIDSIDIS